MLCHEATTSTAGHFGGAWRWQLLFQVVLALCVHAHTAQPFLILVLLLIDYLSAISNILTGTIDEAPKLRALCVSQMKKVWESNINSKGPPFPFWQLCVDRYKFCGGVLDRHAYLTFEEYTEWTGTIHPSLAHFQSCFSLNTWIAFLGNRGTAWAWEPEITALAYLLKTTLAIYSRTNNRKGNHWAFYRPGPGHSLSL